MAPWNPATGEIGKIDLAAEVTNPSFLAVERNYLYACSEAEENSAKTGGLFNYLYWTY